MASAENQTLFNLVNDNGWERVIVFANRKDEVRRIEERLVRDGINAAQLSGDVPQHKRIKTLEGFREGKIRVLVATDVAGRGIHIDGISHVINFTLPEVAEDYVHRIGRTGRAGADGVSISFAGEDDSYQLPSIEETLGRKISCETLQRIYCVQSSASVQSSDTIEEKRSGNGLRFFCAWLFFGGSCPIN